MIQVSFEKLLEQFLNHQVLRVESKVIYRKIISYFVKHHPELQPEDITIDHVISWRSNILLHIKPVSWNTYARHLQVLFNFGIQKNILKRKDNPFENMFIKADEKQIKHLSVNQLNEINDFLTKCKTETDLKFIQPNWFFITLVQTFRYTGIRKKQLLNLKVRNINLIEEIIEIDGKDNKNHNSHIIPISTKLKPYILELIEQHKRVGSQTSDQLFNVNRFKHQSFIVRSMSSHQIDAIFKGLSVQIGFKISPHRFRHTVATTILKNTNNIYLAQKILGHQSIQTTMQYIGHDIDVLKQGVELI